jgi:hypothetical protein
MISDFIKGTVTNYLKTTKGYNWKLNYDESLLKWDMDIYKSEKYSYIIFAKKINEDEASYNIIEWIDFQEIKIAKFVFNDIKYWKAIFVETIPWIEDNKNSYYIIVSEKLNEYIPEKYREEDWFYNGPEKINLIYTFLSQYLFLNKWFLVSIIDLQKNKEITLKEHPEYKLSRCLYCKTDKLFTIEELHFSCGVCWNGMCDDCYNEEKDHTCHYHMISEIWDDDLLEKIKEELWDIPDYICEECVSKINKWK